MPSFSNAGRITLLLLVTSLAGCSEYLDRSDKLSPQAGNAVYSNRVTMMIDPWPEHSADRAIAYDGAVMATAVARYRAGRVIPPNGTGTSSSYAPPPPAAATVPLGPTVNSQAAPVK